MKQDLTSRQKLDNYIRDNYDYCISFAYKYTNNRQNAEDAVQESLMKATVNIDKYDNSKPFNPWFLSILSHTCHDIHKKHSKEVVMDEDDIIGIKDSKKRRHVYSEMRKAELSNDILEAISLLNIEQRQLWNQFYEEGLSREELAEFYNTTPMAISIRLTKIRNAIKNYVGS